MSGGYIPKEEQDQKSLAYILDTNRVNGERIIWIHVPNEGKRSPITAKRLKQQGMKPGCPDNFIFTPPPKMPDKRGTVIELKRAKGGKVSPEQAAWIENLRSIGWEAHICRGIDEAIKVLRECGYLKEAI